MPNDSNLTAVLHELSLSDKETAIYLALLRLGGAPASVLAKQTDMPRPTARFICEQLVSKNLIQGIQKGNVVIYSIDSPERLSNLIDQQEQALSKRKKDLNQIMDSLKTMRNPQTIIPKIAYYEGATSIPHCHQDILSQLTPNTEIITFAKVLTRETQYEPIQKQIESFLQQCVEKKVSTRAILIDSPEARAYKKRDAELMSNTRIMKLDGFDFPGGELLIYGDKAWSLSGDLNQIFGFRIESEFITKLYRGIFEIAWTQAEDN